MNQDASEGVKEVFRQKESKHCYVHVEKGSFFSGEGLALFNIDYGEFSEINTIKALYRVSATRPLLQKIRSNLGSFLGTSTLYKSSHIYFYTFLIDIYIYLYSVY